jgi:hypothetical protein
LQVAKQHSCQVAINSRRGRRAETTGNRDAKLKAIQEGDDG